MAQTPVNDDLVGMTLGGCVVEDLLGQGGMARVYRGKQEKLDRHVAIKVLPPYYASDPAFVERFKLEARAMARLSHPNIVTVHDTGDDAGRLYIIMEFIPGGTLRQRMTAGMPLRDVTRVIHEIADALTYAHSMNIVHRDVKPVNVLMDGAGRAVLSDFGIAKVLQTSAALTHAGAGVGTPEYMSPEQCRGGAVDHRADTYALGVMLYEMLTGHTPFMADNYTALAHAHIYEPVPPPSRFNPRISPAVQAVVLKALEKDPADRFQRALDLALAFEQAVAAQAPVAASTRAAPLTPLAPRQQPQAAPSQRQLPAIICPRCRHANGPQQRYCSACGLPLMGSVPAPVPAVLAHAGGDWMPCPKCHALNYPLHRFCTTCGQSLLVGVAGIRCRSCGARLAAGSRFCTTCGTAVH